MLHTVHFLIEPKEEALREFPLRADALIAEILLEECLTSRAYADRSTWRVREAEVAVKLIYLSRMREYDGLSETDNANRILGSDRISENVFDQWWSIRRMYMEEGSSETMVHYLTAVLDKVDFTGNSTVDNWIESLRSPPTR